MANLLFLDTETTGNIPGTDRLCQVCYKTGENITENLFKPPVPISVKSMSITHITNAMVADKEPFQGSAMETELKKLLESHILVAHNAPFDIAMLQAEGTEVPRHICTLRVAQYLDKEDIIPEYNLQYLRYLLELNVENVIAHDAKGDVLVLEALFNKLLQKMLQETGSQDAAIEEMVKVSQQPFRISSLRFGKYKGEKLKDVAQKDPGYLDWLLGEKQKEAAQDPTNQQAQDFVHSLKYYLGRTT